MTLDEFLKQVQADCPQCGLALQGPFPGTCPQCGFSVSTLAGLGTTDFQRSKWKEHTDILQGRAIQLHGKEWNASFDFNGYAKLDDVVRFTLTYGDRLALTARGGHRNPILLAYIPEPIGSGTSLHQYGSISCSGLCVVSPHSVEYGHAFPVMDPWVTRMFGNEASWCRICNRPTLVAQPVCERCYIDIGGDWKRLI